MAELDVLLGHLGGPKPTLRPCARCGRYRGHGQKYCADCRDAARRDYNAEYHRRHYRRLTLEQLSAVRRAVARRRWSKSHAA